MGPDLRRGQVQRQAPERQPAVVHTANSARRATHEHHVSSHPPAYYTEMTNGADAAPTPPATDPRLDEFRALVRAAFEQALNSGKTDWDEMTSAVLKNRLLALTDRQFSQTRYGSPSFIHLVRRVPDLIELLSEQPPFLLKLRPPLTNQPGIATRSDTLPRQVDEELFDALAHGNWRRVRIREDLWRAVVDYSTHRTYVLDPDTGLARPKEVADSELPQIPTITPEELSGWRQGFVDGLPEPTKGTFTEELREWIEGRGRQSDLPRPVRGLWAEFVKRTVGTRILEWFKAQGEFPPNDMFIEAETRTLPPAEAIDEVVRTRQLRDLIIRAVRTMTYEELAQLPLPASILVRVVGSKSGHES